MHHANQYVITENYEDREGLSCIVGGRESGYRGVLELHQRYRIPINLHLSGTLLEALAWHNPNFLELVNTLRQEGLLELVGSCYAQNVMTFYSRHHNLLQLREALLLYEEILGIPAREVQVFWPPERLWKTRYLVPLITASSLPNHGYRSLLLDDRVLLPDGPRIDSPRRKYDQTGIWPFGMPGPARLDHGKNLVTFPISATLRRHIPPADEISFSEVEWFLREAARSDDEDRSLTVYADDLEKTARSSQLRRYSEFLHWLSMQEWIRPIQLSEWLAENPVRSSASVVEGTYHELAQVYGAGEDYEAWFQDEEWRPYWKYYESAEAAVRRAGRLGGDSSLLELAWKQLLASAYETAWHELSPSDIGPLAGWVKAVTSHSRCAMVVAEAALWKESAAEQLLLEKKDIDGDGFEELLLKGSSMMAVVTPDWGGRLVYLFDLSGDKGCLAIGNPIDDWNLQEELNKYMIQPPNHPGALVDYGLENAPFDIQEQEVNDSKIRVTLCREGAEGGLLTKEIMLEEKPQPRLIVSYKLPRTQQHHTVGCGVSPDYLNLLRLGKQKVRFTSQSDMREWKNGNARAWIRLREGVKWSDTRPSEFGHGFLSRLSVEGRKASFEIGAIQV